MRKLLIIGFVIIVFVILRSQEYLVYPDVHDYVMPYSQFVEINDSVNAHLSDDLCRLFKEEYAILSIGIDSSGSVDTVSIVSSSGSSMIDSILVFVISGFKFNYPIKYMRARGEEGKLFSRNVVIMKQMVCKKRGYFEKKLKFWEKFKKIWRRD
ncbi:MAG: hypothetical protein H0Z29_07930 [Candidatus Marinimicrobia bacterium]|nr:hypothetical protein [Candidatus Neomarinimicrobiota bacterium]